MLNKSLTFIVLTAFAGFVFFSCGEKKEEKTTGTEKKDTVDTSKTVAQSELMGKLELFVLNEFFPTESFKTLKASGAAYNSKVLADVKNAKNLTTNFVKAINLGVFGADLNYSVCNDQAQSALSYLTTSKTLTDELDVPMAFDEEVMKKYQENINKPDELNMIIFDAYDKTSQMLKSNEQLEMSALVIAGSWFEGLYLNVVNYKSGDDVKSFILLQKNQLEKVISIFSEFKDNEYMAGLTADFNSIMAFYTGLKKENEISADEMKSFAKLLTSIRDKIIVKQ
ncbi:MAG: hypothetical protein A2W91_10335 [Bacteroidetes bacterium GWF2_38_335]|nr:MAG: hypothetical protein A2W91_10335 [Bacteroidetes bacterium GWF2_38_335]OFY81898.1 MAG: hypothetical protein A2281_06705 [Bacteroidetes bacterium RIFOXYA12_FULL_38_20]HBS87977.1 hypothetical protein [Bacteroidales bacterium]